MVVDSLHREEKLYPLVQESFLEIDELGQIWRLGYKKRKRASKGKVGSVDVFALPRHRAEHESPQGYLRVSAHVDGEFWNVLAHRLVWLHFYGPIPGLLTVNHKNGRKNDNRPLNLELATHQEQVDHIKRVLKNQSWNHGESSGTAVLTAVQVLEIRQRRKTGEKLTSIADDYGICFQQVSRIARGDRWSFLEEP